MLLKSTKMKILYFANTDWFLYNYSLSLFKFMQTKGYQVCLSSPKGAYSALLQKENLDWQEFPLSRKGMNPLKELQSVQQFQKVLAATQPDILHNFTLKSVLYGSLAAKKFSHIKIINTITGMGFLFINKDIRTRLVRAIMIPLLRYALKDTKVLFLNTTDRNFYLERRIIQPDQAKIVHGSGVDIDAFSPGKPAQKDKKPTIIFPARFLKDKGIYEFVQAARITKKKHEECMFVLVGSLDEGNPSSISEDELNAWLREGTVEWWGWQDEMVKVYQQASIVCLPSYREGLATSLLEAAACAIPIITTDVPGCRELVKNNVTGFIVPAHDAQELARCIIYMVEHPSQSIEMGSRARDFIIEKYSQDTVNTDIYQTYMELGKV